MNIEFKNNKPYIESLCLDNIINSHKTPFYIYSQKEIEKTYNYLKKNLPAEIFFSVKANSNQAILKLMQNLGAGADVVSAGELKRAINANFKNNKIIFEGVGKSKEDIEYAVKNNIKLINIESIKEFEIINNIGKEKKKIVDIGIRINPNIDANTLNKISTGKKTDKFGIDLNNLDEIVKILQSSNNLKLKGISCHIGSQIHEIKIYEKVFLKMKEIADFFLSNNFELDNVDLGGGFGVDYEKDQNKIDIINMGKLITLIFGKNSYKISFEPGRYLTAKSGIIVTRIINTKTNGNVNFLITDAGMHTFIRPSMYNATHRIQPLKDLNNSKKKYTIAGPICESSDIISKDIVLPEQKIDNYLIIHDTGAYGSVMASNYNSRGFPEEILIYQDKIAIIHKNESISEIIKKDIIPEWL